MPLPRFEQLIGASVVALETAGAAVILWGALKALVMLVRERGNARDAIRRDFGRALLLALDFTIGSDVLKVAVAPSFDAVLVVAVVVLVRVVLTFVLERELKQNQGSG